MLCRVLVQPGRVRSSCRGRTQAQACSRGVLVEVLLQGVRGRAVLVAPGEEVRDHLAGPGDLRAIAAGDPRNRGSASVRSISSSARWNASRAVSGLRELQREARLISLPTFPSCSASDNVHHRPPARSRCRGSVTAAPARSTSWTIASRVPGSSTPRDRFPNEGRRLIIESNSSQSSPRHPGRG